MAPFESMTPSIAYFINQYPKVSHSFIRREILALERQGIPVLRIALRGWDGVLVDAEDQRERSLTRYVLQDGVWALLWAAARVLLTAPKLFCNAFVLAVRMGWRAERPLPYHLVYLAEACRLRLWLGAAGVQHVHAHFGTNSTEVVMLSRALGGPGYSFTVHGTDDFDNPLLLGMPEKVSRARFVVASSSYGRGQLYRWIDHALWPKIQVVHCGLEPAFHAQQATPPPATPRLVCVGRLCKEKGQLLLLEAIQHLARKGVRVELVLAGDGELRAEVARLIAQYDLDRQVRITGWISNDQVRAEIVAARGLILPSFAEGLPVVLMEAMALHRTVLTTHVAGIPELVCPGNNGWLFPAGDTMAMVAAIEDWLARTTDELRAMGEDAHRRALQRHSVDVEAAKLAELFRNAGRSRTPS